MKDFLYKTTFASIPKIISSDEENNKQLALASLEPLRGLVPPNIDFDANADAVFCTANAALANFVNKNGDSIDNTSAVQIYKNFIHKFCDLEHKRDKIIGSIINAGFSSFGDNTLLTEEDVLNTHAPVNISLAMVVWRVLNEDFADRLIESSDETSLSYNKVSLSWELGFHSYQILLGSKNLSEAEIITDEKQIKEFSKYLQVNRGTGYTKDKIPVYRKIVGDMYPLGVGMVARPAANVSGVLVVDNNIKPDIEEIKKNLKAEEGNSNEVVEIESSKAKDSESKENKTLNKPFRTSGGPKKFSVYVKNDKGNIVKVNFGDPNMEIKRDNPERKKSFRARHGCDKNPGPKWKAKYWSCKMWSSTPVSSLAFSIDEAKEKGLWENIQEKKKRMGDDYKPAKPGDEDYPDKEGFERAQAEEWDGKMFLDEAYILKENPSLALITEEVNEEDENECGCECGDDENNKEIAASHDHYTDKCSCGNIISNCRCSSPDKKINIIESGCKDCKEKQEILAKKQENNKIFKENNKIIANENKKCVNNNTDFNKITNNTNYNRMKLKFKDITKESLESIANVDLYELAKELNDQTTKYANDLDSKASEVENAKKEVANIKSQSEVLAAELEKVKADLTKLEEVRAKEKVQSDFNSRMSELNDKYTIEASQAKSIAKQIRGLNDESYATWLEDHSVFLVAKEDCGDEEVKAAEAKAAKDKMEKEKADKEKADMLASKDGDEDDKTKMMKAKKSAMAALIDEIKTLKPETKPIENKLTGNKSVKEVWAEVFAGIDEK